MRLSDGVPDLEERTESAEMRNAQNIRNNIRRKYNRYDG